MIQRFLFFCIFLFFLLSASFQLISAIVTLRDNFADIFITSIPNMSPDTNYSGTVLFMPARQVPDGSQRSYWCAKEGHNTTSFPLSTFRTVCSALEMKFVEDSVVIKEVNTSNIPSDVVHTKTFFSDLSCPSSSSIDSCSVQLYSTDEPCDAYFEFDCDNYYPQENFVNAQADVFTHDDTGVVLFRPKWSEIFGTVCSVGTVEGQDQDTTNADTARALCGMQGFRHFGASLVEYGNSKDIEKLGYDDRTKSPDYFWDLRRSYKNYLSDLVCPPYALSIADCNYSISYSRHSADNCYNPSRNNWPLRLRCVVPSPQLNSVILRNSPSGKLEGREHCSRIWHSVCDDGGLQEEPLSQPSTAMQLCRIMGYDPPLTWSSMEQRFWTNLGSNGYSTYPRMLSTFILDDIHCPSIATDFNVFYLNNQCNFSRPFHENCARQETVFLTSTSDPDETYNRTRHLCGGDWRALLTYNPFLGTSVQSKILDREPCRFPPVQPWQISWLGLSIFLMIVGGIVVCCWGWCCFGCSQYDDEDCCSRWSSCMESGCDECLDFACDRVCCCCCNDAEEPTFMQGCWTSIENCFSHYFVMCCLCGEGWAEYYQRVPGPNIAAQEADLHNDAENAQAEDGEEALQFRHHNRAEEEEMALTEAQNNTGNISLKPVDVSQKFAMEQEARVEAVKILTDPNGFPSVGKKVGSSASPGTRIQVFQSPVRNNNNNDDDDANDPTIVSQALPTDNNITERLFLADPNPDEYPFVEVPVSLAKWWTRNFVAEIHFASNVKVANRVKTVFNNEAGTIKVFVGYESCGARFFLLVCVAVDVEQEQNAENVLKLPYRSRLRQIAKATTQSEYSTTAAKSGDEVDESKNEGEETSSTREPIFTDDNNKNPLSAAPPASSSTYTTPEQQSNNSNNNTNNDENKDKKSPNENPPLLPAEPITSYHFFRLHDFCRLMQLPIDSEIVLQSLTKLDPKNSAKSTDEDAATNSSNHSVNDDEISVVTGEDSARHNEEEAFNDKHIVTIENLEDDGLDDDVTETMQNKQKRAVAKFNANKGDSSSCWSVRCSVCFSRFFIDLPLRGKSLESVFPGCECSNPNGRHFTCGPCLGRTISRFIEKGDVIFSSLPCYNGDCFVQGTISLNDFSSVLDLSIWRHWQDAIMERARMVGQREVLRGGPLTNLGSMGNARGHAEKIRDLLKPACPKCHMPFMSFSGCVHVQCVVSNAKTKVSCGAVFCGACLKEQPCGKHGSHDFLSPSALHKEWAIWRREKVIAFMERNFAPKSAAARDVLLAAQNHLVAASIWPLPDPWKIDE